MNADQSPISEEAARVRLAAEADFTLGGLTIQPSLRQVRRGAALETVEPRVMEVLVALARANGAVVSREALIESCWGGRTVSDDAIERCVAKLRKDSAPHYTIETIPRVGYRLLRATIEAPAPTAAWWRSRWVQASTAAAFGALLLVGFGGARWTRTPSWALESFQVLVSGPRQALHPALSPDGTMLAYAWRWSDDAGQIYLRNLKDGRTRALTAGKTDDFAPAWSPTGDAIVFVRAHAHQPCELVVERLPMGPERSVGRCASNERTRPAWSAGALYFEDRPVATSPGRVVRLDLASGARSVVTHPPLGSVGDSEPSISADGRELSFKRREAGAAWDYGMGQAVFVQDLAGGTPRRVTDETSDLRGQAWAENGEAIFAAIQGTEGDAIWAYPFPRGAPVRVTFNPLDFGRLSRGPDGLVAAEIYNSRYSLVPPLGADDQSTAAVVDAMGTAYDVDVSRDGAIAAVAVASGDRAIWVDARGAPPRRLTHFKSTALSGARWSPDGRHLAFVARIEAREGLYVIDAAGSGLTRIAADDNALFGAPAWIEHGEALVYPRHGAGSWQLWKISLAPHAVAAPYGTSGWCSVRAVDGTLYGVRERRAGIWRINAAPHVVAPGPSAGHCDDWAVAPDRVAVIDRGNSRALAIAVHWLDGSRDLSLPAPRMDMVSTIALNPRSGEPLYVRQTVESYIGLLRIVKR